MRPLISVIVPCYNARKTLPVAIASLLAQDLADWECIFVDDGSSDDSFAWMQRFGDKRFRCFRHQVNRGRGAARQFALDQAAGAYLCMLDADDWYYPAKLSKQLAAIGREPELILLGADLATVDANGRLAGVRRNRPGAESVVFAPSMIRLDAARRVGFASVYRVAEDRDFILKVLRQGRCGHIPEVLYAYTEYESTTLRKVLDSNRATRDQRAAECEGQGLAAQLSIFVSSYARALMYRAVFAAGLQERMVRARSQAPAPRDTAEFELAWNRVAEVLRGL